MGCDATDSAPPLPSEEIPETPTTSDCSLDEALLNAPLGKDVIPALTNPLLVSASEVAYLREDDLILGIRVGSIEVAIPHNILWHHEVANLTIDGTALAVTYCPLTGSGLVFERADLNGAEFGVSGLLYQNNLVLYDRRNQESLWPQMARAARCGPANSLPLFSYDVLETSWSGWKQLYPNTQVVSDQTGFDRDYTRNPYGNYGEPANTSLLYPMEIDTRRLPKERVLGLPNGKGGLALPFLRLAEKDSQRAVQLLYRGQPIVVLWSSEYDSAMAYQLDPQTDPTDFIVEDGLILDVQTRSTWRVDGRAVAGPLSGKRLRPVKGAYIAYWFAWAAFQPETEIWTE